MTPNVAMIRIQPEHAWCPPIPLPLFLLWIPGILLAPFLILGIWIVCLVYRLRIWRTLGVFGTFFALCRAPTSVSAPMGKRSRFAFCKGRVQGSEHKK